MTEQRTWDAEAWAAREQQHRLNLRAARLADLGNVQRAMGRVLERIRQADAELADLAQTQRDIEADIEADAADNIVE
jgi:hypothetical protein